ncbi:hypothetical protein ACIBUY_14090 [Streptomyces sp. NPDC050085]|uniref:hypothetical protein n=1 Tax=Streptomyces sp. NPDC050085 TaxID=3365600 RepID=UPI0037A29024
MTDPLAVAQEIAGIAAEHGHTAELPEPGATLPLSIEVTGPPTVTVVLDGTGPGTGVRDASVTVETVRFTDLEPDEVVPFLRAVYDGTAYVRAVTKWWQFLLPLTPAGYWLVVPMPGGRAYKELVPRMILTPWLSARIGKGTPG